MTENTAFLIMLSDGQAVSVQSDSLSVVATQLAAYLTGPNPPGEYACGFCWVQGKTVSLEFGKNSCKSDTEFSNRIDYIRKYHLGWDSVLQKFLDPTTHIAWKAFTRNHRAGVP